MAGTHLFVEVQTANDQFTKRTFSVSCMRNESEGKARKYGAATEILERWKGL
jgi:hypothetical protein